MKKIKIEKGKIEFINPSKAVEIIIASVVALAIPFILIIILLGLFS